MNSISKQIVAQLKEDNGYVTNPDAGEDFQHEAFALMTNVKTGDEAICVFNIVRNNEDDSILVCVFDVCLDSEGSTFARASKWLEADLFQFAKSGSDQDVIDNFNKKFKKVVVSNYFEI